MSAIAKMSFKKILIILAMIAVSAILATFIVFPFFMRLENTRKDINIHSDMSFLNACIRENLQEFYKANDRYPENLQALRTSIAKKAFPNKLPDGPNVMDYFNNFHYSSDGNSYEVNYQAKQGTTQFFHKENAYRGEFPNSELYVDGKLTDKEKN
jgi:hypothetical protein